MPRHGARQETLDDAPAKRDRKQKKEKKEKKDKKDKKEKKEKKAKKMQSERKRSLRSASASGDEASLEPAGSAAAASSVAKQPRRCAPTLSATEPLSAAAEAFASAGTAATPSAVPIDAAPASVKKVFPQLKGLGGHSTAREVQRNRWRIMHDNEAEAEMELAGLAPKNQAVEVEPELADGVAAERADRGLGQQGERRGAQRELDDAQGPLRSGGDAVLSPQADEEMKAPFVRDESAAPSCADTLSDSDVEEADTQLNVEEVDAAAAVDATASATEDEEPHAEARVPRKEGLSDVSAALREQPPDVEVPEEQGEQGLGGESLSEEADGEHEVALTPPQPIAGPQAQVVGLDIPTMRPQPREAPKAPPAGLGPSEEAATQMTERQAFHKVFLLGEQAVAGHFATLEAAFSACTAAEAQIQRFHQDTKDFQLMQAREFSTAMMEEDRCRREQMVAENALAEEERQRAAAVAAEHVSWANTREAHTKEIEDFLAKKRAQMQGLERERETRRQEEEAAWGAGKDAALAKIKVAVGAMQQARAAIQGALVVSSQNKERWEASPPSVAQVTVLIAEAAGGKAADEALAAAQKRVEELRRLGHAAFPA